jgi:hypothetical protein
MRSCVFCSAALLMTFCGCVSVDRDAQQAVAALRSGNNAQAEAWSTDLAKRYADAARERGVRINLDTSKWRDVGNSGVRVLKDN